MMWGKEGWARWHVYLHKGEEEMWKKATPWITQELHIHETVIPLAGGTWEPGRRLGAESRRRDEAALRSPHFLSFSPLPRPTHPKVPHPKQFSSERNCSAERMVSSDTVWRVPLSRVKGTERCKFPGHASLPAMLTRTICRHAAAVRPPYWQHDSSLVSHSRGTLMSNSWGN